MIIIKENKPDLYSLAKSLAILEKYKYKLTKEQYDKIKSNIKSFANLGMYLSQKDIIDNIKILKGELSLDELISNELKERLDEKLRKIDNILQKEYKIKQHYKDNVQNTLVNDILPNHTTLDDNLNDILKNSSQNDTQNSNDTQFFTSYNTLIVEFLKECFTNGLFDKFIKKMMEKNTIWFIYFNKNK